MNAPVVFFHNVGYLRVPGLVGAEECANLREIADRVAEQPYNGQVTNKPGRTRIDRAVSMDSAYLAIATSDRLLNALDPVLGPNVELVENRHNHLSTYREPSTDRLHRDVLQWSRSILTVLVYLSDCTDLASATRIIPANHLWPSTGRPNNGGTWLDQSSVYSSMGDQAVPLPASAGDAILMHGQLYHAGGGASAEGPRVVLTLAYRSVDELSEEDPRQCRLVNGRRIYSGRNELSHA
ncbi:phytanoyl-CoA dioxygenase family protein [Frankia sp. Cj5]|uniref:phytanoyl-CoA dioxygenase family protein n=1 Tax=Frankia sp. Cj5 TaxID=2880978 RepID=UPI00351D0DDE